MNIELVTPSWKQCAQFLSRVMMGPIVGLCGTTAVMAQLPGISFREQIQPILAENCFSCHGPDEHQRQADLRLDQVLAANSTVIVPGKPDESELVRRIYSTLESEAMPPAESNRQLTDIQRELLRRWIEEGANWQQHWAFEPIQKPEPPQQDSDWPKNPIDRFVWARMVDQNLTPSPPADRRTLIRRAYFDLIGIAPTAEQTQVFVDDHDENAWEKVIDGLLASPHFGEQMALEWLDTARFADTNGFQNDFYRSMWPWRDWVIEAFNRNLRYDQFIIEQLAGDLLTQPTNSQLIATGFNRNNRSVTEGGAIEEEWRIENCVDRVETTAAAFLGLTLGCCRCHDHKYDPISQQEFYQFFAFFNNIDELGVYNETRGNVGPVIKLPTVEQQTALDQLDEKMARTKQLLESAPDQSARLVETWQQQLNAELIELPSARFQWVAIPEKLPTGICPVGRSSTFPGVADAVAPSDDAQLQFSVEDPFSWTVWVHGNARGSIFGKMDERNEYRGVDGILLSDGRLKIHLIHQWRVNAIAVISKNRLPADEWTHVAVTWDGSSKAAGYKIYFDGYPVEVEVDIDTLSGTIATDVPLRIGQRSRSEFFQGEQFEFSLFDCELTPAQILTGLRQALVQQFIQYDQSPRSQEVDHGRACLTRYLNGLDRQAMRGELSELITKREKLESELQTSMIMRERAQYRETFLLRRGQYDQPATDSALWPAIPGVLPPLTADQPANRLGLARWMVDERNPLVARVAVNRAWMKYLGRGLVESVDNFGVQGSPPSHPLLIDWLAREFRSSEWNLKQLHKLILMSATYQQSSTLTAERAKIDPENRWYSRGPRYRLSAEQIRDNSLALAGLLVEKIGGPSVRPYQPAGLWEELAGGANDGPYQNDHGDNLYRRSLYTYRKRTVSHPTVATFDAPSWEICRVNRGRTNTPLQSLALLNDTTYVEAARKFAERMLQFSEGSIESQIRFGFMSATQRAPTPHELSTLVASHNVYQDYYVSNSQEARELLATGESPAQPSLPVDKLAAMTAIASVLLNLDEVITKE